MILRVFLFAVIVFCCHFSHCQDSLVIKVHFLYGSKPKKEFRSTEPKWFGGMLGGHVGIEYGTNRFYSFEGRGRQHIFAKRKNRHSIYRVIDSTTFWNIMGTSGDKVKRLTIVLPVLPNQTHQLDSITKTYLAETPYDYALFGMRCGASTYEILAKLGFLKRYSHFWTYMKIFYPRKLRKRLIAKAESHEWTMTSKKGTTRRKWERDVN
jgi:hypothetical protein